MYVTEGRHVNKRTVLVAHDRIHRDGRSWLSNRRALPPSSRFAKVLGCRLTLPIRRSALAILARYSSRRFSTFSHAGVMNSSRSRFAMSHSCFANTLAVFVRLCRHATSTVVACAKCSETERVSTSRRTPAKHTVACLSILKIRDNVKLCRQSSDRHYL